MAAPVEVHGSVYFAMCEAGDRVKIGFTFGSPEMRVRALRHDPAYPEPMTLAAVLREVPRTVEKEIHRQFRADVCKDVPGRELFHASPRLVDLIRRVRHEHDATRGQLVTATYPSILYERPASFSFFVDGNSREGEWLTGTQEGDTLVLFMPASSEPLVLSVEGGGSTGQIRRSTISPLTPLPATICVDPSVQVLQFQVSQKVRAIAGGAPWEDLSCRFETRTTTVRIQRR